MLPFVHPGTSAQDLEATLCVALLDGIARWGDSRLLPATEGSIRLAKDEQEGTLDYAWPMNRLGILRSAMDRYPTVMDAGIAMALGVIALLSLWLEWSIADPLPTIPVPLAVTLLVLLVIPLIWRRRYPYAVLATCTIIMVVASVVKVPGLAWTVNAWALAFYSAGVYGQERWRTPLRLIALAAFIGVVVYEFAWLSPQRSSVSPEFLMIVPILANILVGGATWWFSDAVRISRERQVQLTARTRQLEEERELNARRAVLDERVRIARELHDVVAHHVSLMGVQAGAARRVLPRDPAKAEEMLNAIEGTSREAVTELQRLLGFLRRDDDNSLAPQPSLQHLDALLTQMQEAGLPVALNLEGNARPLPPGVDLSAYRIVQEALTNTLKHAGPACAVVTLRYGQQALDIDVSDDGVASANVSPKGGNGMLGMRERVALLGGWLQAGPQPEAGFRVRAHLPLDPGPA
jgi:signal transduction histidine kinase